MTVFLFLALATGQIDRIASEATTLEAAGRVSEARDLWLAAARSTPDPALILRAAVAESALGRFASAEQLIRDAIPRRQSATLRVRCFTQLGTVLAQQGRHSEANAAFDSARKLAESGLPPDSKELAGLKYAIASANWSGPDLNGVNRLMGEVVALLSVSGSPVEAASATVDWATILFRIGKQKEAKRRCQPALDVLTSALGPEHPATVQREYQCAVIQIDTMPVEAERKLLHYLSWWRKHQPDSVDSIASALSKLADVRIRMHHGRAAWLASAEALALARESLTGNKALLGTILMTHARGLKLQKQRRAAAECEREAARLWEAVRISNPAMHSVDARSWRP
jgi:tetratricopeptide (TPR) repeat protein